MTITDLTTATPAEIDTELFEQVLTKAQRHEATITNANRQVRRYRKFGHPVPDYLHERIAEAQDALDEVMQEAAPYDDEYDRRGGWVRYLVVAGGHLHYQGCHTLTPGRTMVGLVYEASGLTADQVVGKYGETACTHCFPDAPVAEKRTPEQDGFCQHSGQPITDKQRAALDARWGDSWHRLAVAPSVRCECGGHPSITKTDKVRKHKPGTPK